MTLRERNLAVWRREPVNAVMWQPRIEHWYNMNRAAGTLPPRYRNMSLLGVFDDLGCSLRPYDHFNSCIRIEDAPEVTVERRTQDDLIITVTRTPVGELSLIERVASDSHHPVKYPVVTPDDMRVVEWVLQNRGVAFDDARYADACARIGDRAAPCIYIPRINIMRLVIDLMGFENGLRALLEMPDETEQLIRVINETDDAVLDVVCASPIEIVNFGDNVHQALCPPPIFKRWVMPEYQRRNDRLHAAGKKTYSHWDGDCAQLLPYLQDCGFDGVEAVTPVPQGDVTLEQVRDTIGDLVMVDGIPCTDFLPSEPLDSLVTNTRKCIEYFHPCLVLGISDELSPIGDIERVRLVGEICSEYK